MKLFIHGVPDTGFMWTPLIEALDIAGDEYLAPTMPGFDGSFPAGFAATKETYLDWLVQTLEATAQAHGPVDLVGHDWGAPLCAMAAEARPDTIRSWTVVNAVPEPSTLGLLLIGDVHHFTEAPDSAAGTDPEI